MCYCSSATVHHNTIHLKHYPPPEIVVLKKEYKKRALKKGYLRNCCSQEGIEAKSFEEGLSEDISLAFEKFHRASEKSQIDNSSYKRREESGGAEHYSSKTLSTSRNCCSQEGMEAKSFEEGLFEVTETLKRLQSTLLFHQSKLEESFRRARQDISLAIKKFHRASKKSQIDNSSNKRREELGGAGLLLAFEAQKGDTTNNMGSRNHMRQDFAATPCGQVRVHSGVLPMDETASLGYKHIWRGSKVV
ncbi:hypothetical protein Tco_0444812 [Tanacetum coccineum]